jgi:hypothetical protein
MVAIAALGIDVNRITILVGAFGSHRFRPAECGGELVAGVALLLEHRIHVGDSLHIGIWKGGPRHRDPREHHPHAGRG